MENRSMVTAAMPIIVSAAVGMAVGAALTMVSSSSFAHGGNRLATISSPSPLPPQPSSPSSASRTYVADSVGSMEDGEDGNLTPTAAERDARKHGEDFVVPVDARAAGEKPLPQFGVARGGLVPANPSAELGDAGAGVSEDADLSVSWSRQAIPSANLNTQVFKGEFDTTASLQSGMYTLHDSTRLMLTNTQEGLSETMMDALRRATPDSESPVGYFRKREMENKSSASTEPMIESMSVYPPPGLSLAIQPRSTAVPTSQRSPVLNSGPTVSNQSSGFCPLQESGAAVRNVSPSEATEPSTRSGSIHDIHAVNHFFQQYIKKSSMPSSPLRSGTGSPYTGASATPHGWGATAEEKAGGFLQNVSPSRGNLPHCRASPNVSSVASSHIGMSRSQVSLPFAQPTQPLSPDKDDLDRMDHSYDGRLANIASFGKRGAGSPSVEDAVSDSLDHGVDHFSRRSTVQMARFQGFRARQPRDRSSVDTNSVLQTTSRSYYHSEQGGIISMFRNAAASRTSIPLVPIHRIVITGGPCSGKSTCMSYFRTELEKLHYNVYFVPEVATILFNGGLRFGCAMPEERVTQQRVVLQLMMMLEDCFYEEAYMRQKPSVILYDRGTMDGSAYLPQAEWDEVLAVSGYTNEELRDARYDAVIHLVTTAIGAQEHYTTENNSARTETPDQAASADVKTRQAWCGHPLVTVIDNSTDFPTKLKRALDVTCRVIGVKAQHPQQQSVKRANRGTIPGAEESVPIRMLTDTFVSSLGSTQRTMENGSVSVSDPPDFAALLLNVATRAGSTADDKPPLGVRHNVDCQPEFQRSSFVLNTSSQTLDTVSVVDNGDVSNMDTNQSQSITSNVEEADEPDGADEDGHGRLAPSMSLVETDPEEAQHIFLEVDATLNGGLCQSGSVVVAQVEDSTISTTFGSMSSLEASRRSSFAPFHPNSSGRGLTEMGEQPKRVSTPTSTLTDVFAHLRSVSKTDDDSPKWDGANSRRISTVHSLVHSNMKASPVKPRQKSLFYNSISADSKTSAAPRTVVPTATSANSSLKASPVLQLENTSHHQAGADKSEDSTPAADAGTAQRDMDPTASPHAEQVMQTPTAPQRSSVASRSARSYSTLQTSYGVTSIDTSRIPADAITALVTIVTLRPTQKEYLSEMVIRRERRGVRPVYFHKAEFITPLFGSSRSYSQSSRRHSSASGTSIPNAQRGSSEGEEVGYYARNVSTRQITRREFVSLLAHANETQPTVKKTTVRFFYNMRHFTLVTFKEPKEFAGIRRLVGPSDSSPSDIPDWITVVQEVSSADALLHPL